MNNSGNEWKGNSVDGTDSGDLSPINYRKPDMASYDVRNMELRTLHINEALVLNELRDLFYANSASKGFYEGAINVGEKLMLIVSELAEFMEADRKGHINQQCDKPIGLTCGEEELADAVIRIFDFAGALGINLGQAVATKHAYNLSRTHKHGKKY